MNYKITSVKIKKKKNISGNVFPFSIEGHNVSIRKFSVIWDARWWNSIRLTELAIQTVLQLFNVIRTSEHSCKHTYRNPCRADPCRQCNGSPRIRLDVSSPTPPACNGRSRGSHSSYWVRTWSPCTPCTTFWWGSSYNIPTNVGTVGGILDLWQWRFVRV